MTIDTAVIFLCLGSLAINVLQAYRFRELTKHVRDYLDATDADMRRINESIKDYIASVKP